jgi:hypothetical protein
LDDPKIGLKKQGLPNEQIFVGVFCAFAYWAIKMMQILVLLHTNHLLTTMQKEKYHE